MIMFNKKINFIINDNTYVRRKNRDEYSINRKIFYNSFPPCLIMLNISYHLQQLFCDIVKFLDICIVRI